MPGLAYNGTFIRQGDVNSNLHRDILAHENADFHWDGLNLPDLVLPAGGALPLIPGKHKSCWPAQSPSTWLKIKEEQKAKLLNSGVVNEKGVSKCYGSSESEHDLQAMVMDFMENESGDKWDTSDSDNGVSPIAKFCENLQILTSCTESPNRELLANVTMVVLAINEDTDLVHSSEASECKGSCTRRFVVKHLRSSGYNAALCKSRWLNSGRVPGGEYEYIDVIFEGDRVFKERVIVDIDFQAQLEIARPTQHYLTALKSLPAIFVGTTSKLEQVLEIMSEAAKSSYKQNSMHLPPWRTLEYMKAKWLTPCDRRTSDFPLSVPKVPCSLHWRSGMQLPSPVLTKECGAKLRRTQVSLLAEVNGSGLPMKTHGKGRSALRKRMPNW